MTCRNRAGVKRHGVLLFLLTAAVVPASTNLVDSSAVWHTWSPRTELAPVLKMEGGPGSRTLSIRADSFAQYGEWYTVVKGIRAGAHYRFDALYRAASVDRESLNIAAILTWCGNDCADNAIERDYVDRESEAGEWRRKFRVLRAPEGAQAVKVELILRWTSGGSVLWKEVSLSETDPPRPRIVRVATTHLTPPVPSTLEANLKIMGDMLDRAGAQKADVVCMSENVIGRGIDLPVPERAKAVAGPTMKLLAEKARQHRMYVLTTFEEPDGGAVYNTAVFFDREGKLAARYRKMHLPLAEAEMGYTPGNEYSVVDTDFGRVGILICWDYWFPESARILRLKGAEMLLLPLAGDGGRHWDAVTRARALENGVYLVASGLVYSSTSRIIDPAGEVLAEVSGGSALAVKEIDLNKEFREPWLSVGPGLGEGRSLYIQERRPDTYAPLGR